MIMKVRQSNYMFGFDDLITDYGNHDSTDSDPSVLALIGEGCRT